VAAFWGAVEDGDYEFMATRPLDLSWMVNLWNAKHSLGTYLELLDANVSNRLTDVNPSYQQAGVLLSQSKLRKGAEELAAASEFSGQPFVSTTNITASDEVAPNSILSDWEPAEIARLVSSAVFDEATFGRVKFHHRSIREFLAASWVTQQLKLGLPFHRVLPLFSATPFGVTVLIPSRRATLCWLAALNVEVREWVTREFPELLLFEGDPEAWDLATANLAFTRYVERLRAGFLTDWWNEASEFRRVARRLPPGRVARLLAEQEPNSNVIAALLPFVKHGRLLDCRQVIFDMYRRPQASTRLRRLALMTLSAIGSTEQRVCIKEDLLQGRLKSNDLIAAALAAIDWADLTVQELVQVFTAARSEPGYGPMTRAVKEDLLPETTVTSAELLLTGVVTALPVPEVGKRFSRFPEADQPERAWLLDVLPDCTDRLLSLLSPDSQQFPEVCLEAAERVEAFRDSGFVEGEDRKKLHALVAERPALRWKIALEIAQSEDIRHATSRLTWGGWNCLVTFNKSDLPELTTRANDSSVSVEIRAIWFEVGLNLAFRELKGRSRSVVLAGLCSRPDRGIRMQRISSLRSERITGLRQMRKYETDERKRKEERRQAQIRNRENLTRDIEHIRDGSHDGTLHWLINYSYSHSGHHRLTPVDFTIVSRDFGNRVAEAFASGLVVAWSKTVPPNPADYPGGQVPWDAITALAGLNVLLERGVDIAALNDEEAARAAQLAVWELNVPPPWFERLGITHETTVPAALRAWLEAECFSLSDDHRIRGALDVALRSPAPIRARLLQPTAKFVRENRIGNRDTLKSLLEVLRQDGLLASNEAAAVCRAKVETSLTADGLVSEITWLRTWLEEDLESAWVWFDTLIARLGTRAGDQVDALARALVDGKWLREPLSEAKSRVLVQMYRLLDGHPPEHGTPVSNEDAVLGHPIVRLMETIPRMLVQVRGAIANRALIDIANQGTRAIAKEWLDARVLEHAALEAQRSALVEPARLKALGEPFRFEPKSERELFQQALARLEEIRRGIEEGPFSDRLLFSVGIPEKHLQLWLAARLLDTTNRRFSVHREEVVDADNRTDVQLSCQYGNVCVEVKPLDTTRSYSAASLVHTLRAQIIEQYLKGFNSTHGILVLCRLDEKTWVIPGETKARHFTGLVAYLCEQAEAIKRDYPEIDALEVFGIDCVG